MELTQVLDEQYLNYFQEHTELEDRWLLMQNLALSSLRRNILDALNFVPGERVLDLGCGFGALALDLAAKVPVTIEAIDAHSGKVQAAVAISQSVLEIAGSLPGDVSFRNDNGYNLSFADNSFDWVVSQHVFQHLQEPERVMEEIFRVLKPGGRVCIIDVDDGLSISYPEQESFHRLGHLLMTVQESRGGDRRIGRKLAHLLHNSGLVVQSISPIVQTQFLSASDKALMLTVMAEHFRDVEDEAISQGLVNAQEFDSLIEDFVHNPLPHTFEMDVQFVALGQKGLEVRQE